MAESMSESSVFQTFQDIVAKSLNIDPAQVTMNASLTDLGAESLDLVEITMECESALNVWLPEKSILHISREVFGRDAVEQDGRLTALGKRILAERILPEDAGVLQGDVTVEDVERYFLRVGAWVNLLTRLVKDSPTECDVCGGALKQAAGFRLKCASCNKSFQVRSGEELNREWLQQYREKERLVLDSQFELSKAQAQSA